MIRFPYHDEDPRPLAAILSDPPGCVLHRAVLSESDIEERVGYRVTTPLRTLRDVAAGTTSQEPLDRLWTADGTDDHSLVIYGIKGGKLV